MGRLIGLELHNFKSYRGTTSVGFGSAHFTSIIGPNGAGKSNMMDAISFVLGVRSNHLRSAHLKELIYRGRIMENDGSDKDDENDSVNGSDIESDDDTARSTISQNQKLPRNPKTAYVMAIYERVNGEILKLQRRITATGSSEYRINKKIVSATEYSSVLKKENILIKARNFLVFQGDVEQIASQSPQDLTKLIETISGSTEFKKEHDSLKEELEKAHEDTNGYFQRKRILNGELKQYKEQKTESEHFEKKIAEKNNLIKIYKLWQLFNFENTKNDLIDKLEVKNEELKRVEQRLRKEEKLLKNLNADYSKSNLETMKQKSAIDTKNQKLNFMRKELLPFTTKRDLTIKKIADIERKIKEIQIDVKTQTQNIKDLENLKSTVDKSFKIFERTNAAEEQVFDLPEEGKEQYNKLRQEFLARGGAILEGELNVLNNDKSPYTLQVENLETQKKNVLSRLSSLRGNLALLNKQFTENKANLDDAGEELSIKKNYLNEMRAKKERLLTKEFEINSEIKEILLKLDDLTASRRESNRDRKLRENVSNLQRLFSGVKGLVCDLCKPKQKKYETAVATILGKNFDSVIVDNITVAQKCIAYLKEQRAGVASFIPLDSVDTKPSNSNLRHIHPSAKPILDVIEYDPALERAMQYACGDSIVCDDISVAKYIRWNKNVKVKIVTLDGSLIHKAGLMTGGRSKNDNRSWDKSEFQNLIKKKDDLMSELKVVQAQKPSEVGEKQVLNEITEIETSLPLLKNKTNEIQRNIDDTNREIDFQQETLQKLETELVGKNKSLFEVNSSINQCQEKIKELQETVYSEFIAKYDVSIEKYEKTHGKLLREKDQERAKFMKQISTLENKIEFENERLEQSKTRLNRIEEDKIKISGDLIKIKEQRSKIQDETERLETEIEDEEEKAVKLERTLKHKLSQSKSVEETLNDIKSHFEKLFKKCSSLEEDIEKEIMNKIDILRNCKIENVSIPLLEGSLDSIPITENPENLIEISEDIVIDYGRLPQKYQTLTDYKAMNREFNERIRKVNEQLEALSPNTKALGRLQEVEGRLREVDENHNRTREREEVLIDRFNEIKEKRYERFMQAFDFIATKIDSTYKELTKSNASPLGGSAYLTLEDEEEPYNAGIKYHAMPPLKRFRDMELLSGGEKTVAALALLFAIHSYQPSPFFVLDEVDAALDNANVQRVANYISSHAGPSFQFIVISLKNGLFERSDALVGIYREQVQNSSRTMTLDLRNYPE